MPYELIDAGYLVKPTYIPVRQADLDKVGTTVSGDFDEGQLALAYDRPELVQQIVQDWLRLASGRRTIAFTVNVSHAMHVCQAFCAVGIPSAYVCGATPAKQTDQIYRQFADGEILVLASCMKVVEGFDVPSTSAALLCRPTNSPALHFQMLGRVLRLSPETGKLDAIVLDQAGNLVRHGFVEDIKSISLEPASEPQAIEAPKKVCPSELGGCGVLLYAFQMKCTNCGYLFEQPRKIYLIPELEEVIRKEDQERYKFYRKKLREAFEKNFDPGWAAHVFREKYGHWPPNAWAKGAVFGANPTQLQRSSYHKYLSAIARRKEKPESWSERYMTLEFGFVLSAIGSS